MIFTQVDTTLEELDNREGYHIETATVSNGELNKKILRVTTDHGNDYGIRLDSESERLQDGSVFFLDPQHLLVVTVHSEELLIITPTTIDEMGEIAHMLGNTHKPVVVENGKIILELDPTVIDLLEKKQIPYTQENIKLKKPLKHVDLSHAHN